MPSFTHSSEGQNKINELTGEMSELEKLKGSPLAPGNVDVFQRAEKVGMADLYRSFYFYLSNHAHAFTHSMSKWDSEPIQSGDWLALVAPTGIAADYHTLKGLADDAFNAEWQALKNEIAKVNQA